MMEGAVIDRGLLTIKMKKIVLGLLILTMIASTNAYSVSTVESGTRIVTSSNANAIYSIGDDLKIVIDLEEVITHKFEVTGDTKTFIGDKRKIKFDGISHNLKIKNNASDVINSVIIENPFNEINIGKIAMIKPGQGKRLSVDMVLRSSTRELDQLIGRNQVKELLMCVKGEDRYAILREMVELEVRVTTIEKESITYIEPEVVTEAAETNDDDVDASVESEATQ